MPEAKRPYPEFLPLRRFAKNGLYSVAYLSLLVQRGNLRARKIGRNYYTTVEDFREYLDKHAREEIRAGYLKLLEPGVGDAQTAESADSGFFVGRKRRVAATFAGAAFVFLFLIFSVWLYSNKGDSGQVAGAEEGLAGTTTIGRFKQ